MCRLLPLVVLLSLLSGISAKCVGPPKSHELVSYNVQAYGAKGDGVTDDSAAVAKAALALSNSCSGGALLFPDGVYLLDGPVAATQSAYVTLSNANDLYVLGSSQENTTILFNLNIANAISFIPTPHSSLTGSVRVDYITIKALPVNVSLPYYSGIVFASASSATVTNVAFESQVGGYGITIHPNTLGVSISNVEFQNGGTFVTILDGTTAWITIFDSVAVASEILQTEVQLPLGVDIQGAVTSTTISNVMFVNFTNGINSAGGDVGKSVVVNGCTFVDPINAGVNIADNATVYVYDSSFYTTVAPQVYNFCSGINIMGQYYTSSDADSASLVVQNSKFTSLIIGVAAHTGSVAINGSTFTTNSELGAMLVMSHDYVYPANIMPYNVTFSTFLHNGQGDITADATMVLIIENTCIGTEPSIESDCDDYCVVQNNHGCANNPVKLEDMPSVVQASSSKTAPIQSNSTSLAWHHYGGNQQHLGVTPKTLLPTPSLTAIPSLNLQNSIPWEAYPAKLLTTSTGVLIGTLAQGQYNIPWVQAIDMADGSQLWNVSLDRVTVSPSISEFSAISADEQVYFTGTLDMIYAISIESGKIIWNMTYYGYQSPPAITLGPKSGLIYVRNPYEIQVRDPNSGKLNYVYCMNQYGCTNSASMKKRPSLKNKSSKGGQKGDIFGDRNVMAIDEQETIGVASDGINLWAWDLTHQANSSTPIWKYIVGSPGWNAGALAPVLLYKQRVFAPIQGCGFAIIAFDGTIISNGTYGNGQGIINFGEVLMSPTPMRYNESTDAIIMGIRYGFETADNELILVTLDGVILSSVSTVIPQGPSYPPYNAPTVTQVRVTSDQPPIAIVMLGDGSGQTGTGMLQTYRVVNGALTLLWQSNNTDFAPSANFIFSPIDGTLWAPSGDSYESVLAQYNVTVTAAAAANEKTGGTHHKKNKIALTEQSAKQSVNDAGVGYLVFWENDDLTCTDLIVISNTSVPLSSQPQCLDSPMPFSDNYPSMYLQFVPETNEYGITLYDQANCEGDQYNKIIWGQGDECQSQNTNIPEWSFRFITPIIAPCAITYYVDPGCGDASPIRTYGVTFNQCNVPMSPFLFPETWNFNSTDSAWTRWQFNNHTACQELGDYQGGYLNQCSELIWPGGMLLECNSNEQASQLFFD